MSFAPIGVMIDSDGDEIPELGPLYIEEDSNVEDHLEMAPAVIFGSEILQKKKKRKPTIKVEVKGPFKSTPQWLMCIQEMAKKSVREVLREKLEREKRSLARRQSDVKMACVVGPVMCRKNSARKMVKLHLKRAARRKAMAARKRFRGGDWP